MSTPVRVVKPLLQDGCDPPVGFQPLRIMKNGLTVQIHRIAILAKLFVTAAGQELHLGVLRRGLPEKRQVLQGRIKLPNLPSLGRSHL
jgi:hypothetical protein